MDSKNALIRKAIIEGYRRLVSERYQYEALSHKYELPPSFGVSRVDQLRAFFLDFIYPEYAQRLELDEAFDQLDRHIRHPEQLLRILIDSGRIILTYGRHLPGVLRAGLKALKSFRGANQLEKHLVDVAVQRNLVPPFDDTIMYQLLGALPKAEIDHFVRDNLALFDTLHNRRLVKKIIDIVEYLIKTMKKYPKTYAAEEVKGLIWGRDIIVQGDQLFEQLEPGEQKILFNWIEKIELDFLDSLNPHKP